jgi:hypothetical protein
MARRIQIGERDEGSVQPSKDLWFLVLEDEGRQYIEHAWSHIGQDGNAARSGTKILSVEEFLAGDSDDRLKKILRAALRTIGSADAAEQMPPGARQESAES